MKNAYLPILLFFLLLFFLFSILSPINFTALTGHATINRYTFTKAVCEGNYCQDYEISCEDGSLVEMRAVSEKVRFSEDWQDTRPKEVRDRLC
jgi:hypothetical protein